MNADLKKVAFLRAGKGRDLVLLHGYLSSKEAFLPLIDYFSGSYRVTAIDFCGFGESEALPYAFSVSDYAEWTENAFYSLGLNHPLCIAHSFGCRVAVKMSARAAETAAGTKIPPQSFGGFDKLILTGPAGILAKKTFSYRMKVKTYRFVRKIFPAFAERHFGSEEYRTLSPVMKESYKKIVSEDLRGDIAKTDCETLVIEGEEDRVTTIAEAEEYAALLPGGTLKTIRGGHFAFCENPLDFCLMAEEFFSHG